MAALSTPGGSGEMQRAEQALTTGSPMGMNQGTAATSAGKESEGGSLSGPDTELCILHILSVLFNAVFSVLSVWHKVIARETCIEGINE